MKRKLSVPNTAFTLLALTCSLFGVSSAQTQDNGCGNLPDYAALKTALATAVNAETSGLNNQMWATLVDRDGIVCAVAFSGANRGAQWPGSRVIRPRRPIQQMLSVWTPGPAATVPGRREGWLSPLPISTRRYNQAAVFTACNIAIRSIPAWLTARRHRGTGSSTIPWWEGKLAA